MRQFAQACPTLPDWTWTSLEHKGRCRGNFGELGWGWPTTTFATLHSPRDVPALAICFYVAFAFPLALGNSMAFEKEEKGSRSLLRHRVGCTHPKEVRLGGDNP